MTLKSVGLYYRPVEAREEVDNLELGAELSFELEPENQYDQNAVKVLIKETGTHIGYVPKNDAPFFQGLDEMPLGVFEGTYELESGAIHVEYTLAWNDET